jgi:hypothetical protein
MLRADIHACRFKADVNPVRTIVAFSRGIGIRVDIQRIVWTSLHTAFTTDAPLVVKVDDTVIAGKKCFGWTDGNARSI